MDTIKIANNIFWVGKVDERVKFAREDNPSIAKEADRVLESKS